MPRFVTSKWWHTEGTTDWGKEDDNSLCTQVGSEGRLIEITHQAVVLMGRELERKTRKGFGGCDHVEHLKLQVWDSLKTCKHWEEREPRIQHWVYQYLMLSGVLESVFCFFQWKKTYLKNKNSEYISILRYLGKMYLRIQTTPLNIKICRLCDSRYFWREGDLDFSICTIIYLSLVVALPILL